MSSLSTSSSIGAFFSPLLPKRCPSPPCICDLDDQQRKVVTCSTGLLHSIPIHKMDPETQIINIIPQSDRYNSLTLSRMFTNMTMLEEIHIQRSKLPAIGESIFCPVLQCVWSSSCPTTSSLRVLDLSQNNIVALVQSNFNCLDLLEILDLSENNLSGGLPSAPFNRLKSLRKLSLARNRLTELVPLMFHSLHQLEELDLSENPLSGITSSELKFLPNLRVLNLNGCQLSRLDGQTFSALSNLEFLDLSDNHLKHLNHTAFDGLLKLRVLLLNRNSLTVLPDNLFSLLHLDRLDLSNNLINPLTNCVFCQVDAIKHLDLSNNKITSFSSVLLEPLANSLEHLYIDRNRNLIDPPSSLVALLQPLKRLKRLSAADIGLDETLPESTFDSFDSIVFLNISHNKLTELNSRLLDPLTALTALDVSNNKLPFIDPSTFQIFHKMRFLSEVYLHGNPFSCYHCQILPFIDWLNTDPAEYWKVCHKLTDDPERLAHCARCSLPSSLEGRYLHEPGLSNNLEWCTNPEVQLRLTASEPQVGLILAFLIILSLVALILVVVAIYRKHGAVYYTQEDKLTSKEEIYAASVGAQPLHWSANPSNRMVSLTSTNYTTSRQNTMFSPQSSMEQNTGPNVNYGTSNNVQTDHGKQQNSTQQQCTEICTTVGCTECANTTAVKQVIASIPAMTELLENSLNKMNQHGNINSSQPQQQMVLTTQSNGGHPSKITNGVINQKQPPPLPLKKSSITSMTIKDDQQKINEEKKDEAIVEKTSNVSVLSPSIEIDYEEVDNKSTDNSKPKTPAAEVFDEKNVQIYI